MCIHRVVNGQIISYDEKPNKSKSAVPTSTLLRQSSHDEISSECVKAITAIPIKPTKKIMITRGEQSRQTHANLIGNKHKSDWNKELGYSRCRDGSYRNAGRKPLYKDRNMRANGSGLTRAANASL